MKTLITLTLACFLMITSTVSATTKKTETNYAETDVALLTKQLQKYMYFPEWTIEELKEKKASVLLTVSAAGEITVISVRCDNEELRKQITKRLDKTVMANLSGTPDQLIRVTINFK